MNLVNLEKAVTHDRWFLDAVCEQTWELADGQLHAYDGGHAAYVLARAEPARIADAAQRRRRNLLLGCRYCYFVCSGSCTDTSFPASCSQPSRP